MEFLNIPWADPLERKNKIQKAMEADCRWMFIGDHRICRGSFDDGRLLPRRDPDGTRLLLFPAMKR